MSGNSMVSGLLKAVLGILFAIFLIMSLATFILNNGWM